MINKIITLSILLVYNIAISQIKKDFKPVLFTFNNGKIIKGYTSIPKVGDKTKSFEFKENLNNTNIETFKVSEIKSFIIDSVQNYEVLKVQIDKKNSSVLCKLMIKGKASLYQTAINNIFSYVVKNNNKVTLLREDELKHNDIKITKYHFYGKLNYILDGFLDTKNLKTNFSKSFFQKTIISYNQKNGSESIINKVVENKKAFIILSAMVNLWEKNRSEFSTQLIYRKYITDISNKTSLNIGLNYYRYNITEEVKNRYDISASEKSWSNLYNIPLYLQYDFIKTNNLRSNIFLGVQASYINVGGYAEFYQKDELQKTYGVSFLYGLGLEYDINNYLMLNASLKQSLYTHLPMIGISYYFEKK